MVIKAEPAVEHEQHANGGHRTDKEPEDVTCAPVRWAGSARQFRQAISTLAMSRAIKSAVSRAPAPLFRWSSVGPIKTAKRHRTGWYASLASCLAH